jgi:hypothetical protein
VYVNVLQACVTTMTLVTRQQDALHQCLLQLIIHVYESSLLAQEKERLKAEKDAVEKKYKTAKVDGRVEQVTLPLFALRCCKASSLGPAWPDSDACSQG